MTHVNTAKDDSCKLSHNLFIIWYHWHQPVIPPALMIVEGQTSSSAGSQAALEIGGADVPVCTGATAPFFKAIHPFEIKASHTRAFVQLPKALRAFANGDVCGSQAGAASEIGWRKSHTNPETLVHQYYHPR